MLRYYDWAGGRKMGAGYIAVALFTALAKPLGASFAEYAGAVLLALGITVGSVAYEDSRRPASRPE